VSFAAEIEQFAGDALEQVERIRRVFIGKLCIMIIDKTPVLTGHLKGNWQASVGTPEMDEVPRKSKAGGFVKQQALDVLARLQGDETFYFSNNAPYVLRIEYEGHSSVKAPDGMARISLLAVGQLINQAVREGELMS
jgi:hypothetical protein